MKYAVKMDSGAIIYTPIFRDLFRHSKMYTIGCNGTKTHNKAIS
jgi:hypothetical protein